MIVDRRTVAWLCPLTLSCLVGSSGCTASLVPERMPVTSVRGKVTENGHPVQGGWIEFVPVDGTVGKLRSARLHADGTFLADRVPVGLDLIRLVNVDIGDKNAKWLFGAFHSPIRRVIPAQQGAPLAIDLVDEWNLFRKEYYRQRGSQPPMQDASR